jgi:hypothetical protein
LGILADEEQSRVYDLLDRQLDALEARDRQEKAAIKAWQKAHPRSQARPMSTRERAAAYWVSVKSDGSHA